MRRKLPSRGIKILIIMWESCHMDAFSLTFFQCVHTIVVGFAPKNYSHDSFTIGMINFSSWHFNVRILLLLLDSPSMCTWFFIFLTFFIGRVSSSLDWLPSIVIGGVRRVGVVSFAWRNDSSFWSHKANDLYWWWVTLECFESCVGVIQWMTLQRKINHSILQKIQPESLNLRGKRASEPYFLVLNPSFGLLSLFPCSPSFSFPLSPPSWQNQGALLLENQNRRAKDVLLPLSGDIELSPTH